LISRSIHIKHQKTFLQTLTLCHNAPINVENMNEHLTSDSGILKPTTDSCVLIVSNVMILDTEFDLGACHNYPACFGEGV
jgi:hypothetical protein